jgi:hypothetical protein
VEVVRTDVIIPLYRPVPASALPTIACGYKRVAGSVCPEPPYDRHMRWKDALSAGGLLLLAACGQLSGSTTTTLGRALDEPFTIRVGESVRVGAEGILVGFARVLSDSRCPRDVQCIQAGEAVIRGGVTLPGQTRQDVDLGTTPADGTRAVGEYSVTLANLDPVPVAGRETRASEYTATFVLSRSR